MSSAKPIPEPTTETKTFWDSCTKHKLIYQSCQQCGRAQFPPRPSCVTCGSERIVWKPSSGRGAIHSFTIVHRAPTDAFKKDVPYVIALVDLAEGFRMMMNVRGSDPQAVAIGQKTETIFEDTGEGIVLPQAKLI